MGQIAESNSDDREAFFKAALRAGLSKGVPEELREKLMAEIQHENRQVSQINETRTLQGTNFVASPVPGIQGGGSESLSHAGQWSDVSSPCSLPSSAASPTSPDESMNQCGGGVCAAQNTARFFPRTTVLRAAGYRDRRTRKPEGEKGEKGGTPSNDLAEGKLIKSGLFSAEEIEGMKLQRIQELVQKDQTRIRHILNPLVNMLNGLDLKSPEDQHMVAQVRDKILAVANNDPRIRGVLSGDAAAGGSSLPGGQVAGGNGWSVNVSGGERESAGARARLARALNLRTLTGRAQALSPSSISHLGTARTSAFAPLSAAPHKSPTTHRSPIKRSQYTKYDGEYDSSNTENVDDARMGSGGSEARDSQHIAIIEGEEEEELRGSARCRFASQPTCMLIPVQAQAQALALSQKVMDSLEPGVSFLKAPFEGKFSSVSDTLRASVATIVRTVASAPSNVVTFAKTTLTSFLPSRSGAGAGAGPGAGAEEERSVYRPTGPLQPFALNGLQGPSTHFVQRFPLDVPQLPSQYVPYAHAQAPLHGQGM